MIAAGLIARNANKLGLIRKPWVKSSLAPGSKTVKMYLEEADLLPELQQPIELDRASGQIMYWIIMMLVVFSVVNSFIMTVFERTREFGMLRAIGMRPAKIVLMVLWEAFFLWLIGAAIGLVIASAIVGWLVEVGIYLGEAMEGYGTQFYMPARLHPAFSVEALVTAPVVMFIGTQIGALLPSLRIRHLRPVEALRAE